MFLLSVLIALGTTQAYALRHYSHNTIHEADPTRFGVYHNELVHNFWCNATANHTMHHGVLHVFYRVFVDEQYIKHDMLHLRGVAFWQDSGDMPAKLGVGIQAGPLYMAPELWDSLCYPRVILVDAHGKEVAVNMTVHTPSLRSLPVRFAMWFPRHLRAPSGPWLRFIFPGEQVWPFRVSVYPGVAFAESNKDLLRKGGSFYDEPPKIYTLLRQHMDDPVAFDRVLDVHWWWHQRMKFSGVVLYADTHQLLPLAAQPTFAAHVRHGAFIPIAFDYLQHVEGYFGPEQPMQYTHAILSFKGRNVWFMATDMDEFFMSNIPGMHVQQFLGLVRKVNGSNVGQIELGRSDMSCEECHDKGDFQTWIAEKDSRYKKLLSRYTQASSGDHIPPKGMFDPDLTASWIVHHGLAEEPEGHPIEQAWYPAEAFVGHFADLFRPRNSRDAYTDMSFTAWQWAMEEKN